jgi:hypothetical protein
MLNIPENILLTVEIEGGVAIRSNKRVLAGVANTTNPINKIGESLYHYPVLEYKNAKQVRRISKDTIDYWLDNYDFEWLKDASHISKKIKWRNLSPKQKIDIWCQNIAKSVPGYIKYYWK